MIQRIITHLEAAASGAAACVETAKRKNRPLELEFFAGKEAGLLMALGIVQRLMHDAPRPESDSIHDAMTRPFGAPAHNPYFPQGEQ